MKDTSCTNVPCGGTKSCNVLIMADYRTPCSGNFIASLLELAEKMRDRGNEVYFLFPEHRNGGGYTWTDWLVKNGFSVTLLNDRTSSEEVLNVLQNLIRQHNIKIVHIHFALYHKLLIQNAAKLGVKVLVHDHMDFSPEGNIQKQKLRSLIFSGMYRMKGIHVVSVMELKSKSYLLCGKKYSHYVPNGLSLRRNVPVDVTREERRSELGIAEDEKLCLLLDWDKYRKGMDIAVKAVAKFRETDPNLHLGIIGVGSPPWQSTVDWIKEMTGVDSSCPWLHFFPSFEDMFACHRAADVYLSASRKEAFSYGILEAISQNTPVVVSDIEGTAWATRYDKSVTYPVEDADACADAIRRALEMSRRPSNQDEITAQYSIDLWCDRIMEIYGSMLK